MSARFDFPINDVDNHMYETTDAFTKYLAPEYAGLVKYVQVDGHTKIALRNVISDYIPNPTFEVVARPGAQQDYFLNGNKEGKSRREILGKAMKAEDAFFAPRAPLEADGRARHRPLGHVADPGEPSGAAPRGRSARYPRRHPCPE